MRVNYIKIPKDLNEMQNKLIAGLTKRQIISFSIGAAAAFPIFFLVKNITDNIFIAMIALFITSMPIVMCGIYQKNGIYPERFAKYAIDFYKKPRKRYYRSVCFCECINRQSEFNRLNTALTKAKKYSYRRKDGMRERKKEKKS